MGIQRRTINQSRQASQKPAQRQEKSLLLPMSSAAIRLSQLCQQDRVSAKDVVAVMETDPGLIARLMTLANSSLFGCSGRIKTIDHAVVMLGMKTVRNLALTISASQLFSQKDEFTPWRKGLWTHSITTAVIARRLAPHFEDCGADEAFLAGMFHDVGKLVLFQIKPKHYIEHVLERESESLSSVELEIQTYHNAHTHIGKQCADQWHLSCEITDAIRDHHEPAESISQLGQLIQQANVLSKFYEANQELLTSDAPDQDAAEETTTEQPQTTLTLCEGFWEQITQDLTDMQQ